MDNFLAELKRRNVYRVGAAYAVVAWVLLQLAANVSPILDLPPWIARTILLLLILGFPVALVFAWVHELAPESDARTRVSTSKLDWALMGALVIVIALVSYEQLAPSFGAKKVQGPQAGVATAGVASTTQGATVSIAVLPFVNLSSDTEQEFFSDGMTEEITSALAKVPGLTVIGRTSAFEFKGQNKDLRMIGQALGTTHLIEGSVRKAGARVRITAQLIVAESGAHLWTENYDRELTDIFAVQQDIATAIAGALRVPLGLKQGDTLVRARTKDLTSYNEYLRALALRRAGRNGEAIAILEATLDRDPDYAPAWVSVAQAYNSLPFLTPAMRRGPVEDARLFVQASQSKAEKAAREAIRLDFRNAGGYGALAYIQALRGKWTEAEDLFQQALTLDADERDVLNRFSQLLGDAGRFKQALSVSERLRVLEPLVSSYSINTSYLMQYNGRSKATIPILEGLPADGAQAYARNVILARAYAAEGRFGDAADTLLYIKDENQVTRRSVEDAARLLRAASSKRGTRPDALPRLDSELNFVYVYAGAPERVLEYLERNLEIHYTIGRDLWLPEYAPLRKTERFKAFVRKAGFVEYWRERGWADLCHPVGTSDFACD